MYNAVKRMLAEELLFRDWSEEYTRTGSVEAKAKVDHWMQSAHRSIAQFAGAEVLEISLKALTFEDTVQVLHHIKKLQLLGFQSIQDIA